MLDLVGGGSVEIVPARIEQLPFKDSSFNVVLSSAAFDRVVYHQDQDEMMKEIARVLGSGGIYIGYNEFRMRISPVKGFESIPNEYDLKIYKKS